MTPVIEIDGNDGVGKTTLVTRLRSLGIHAKDRGRMTLATDDPSVVPEPGVTYILLDAPPSVSTARLRIAGKDLTEAYHTPEALNHYYVQFAGVAIRFGAHIVPAYSETQTLIETLSHIRGRAFRLGMPKGRLMDPACRCLDLLGFGWFKLDGRGLTMQKHGIEASYVKPRSIPQLIAMNLLDAGFVGRDILMDSLYQEHLEVIAETRDAQVRIVAASDRADILTHPPRRPLIVATEFPNLVREWLGELGMAHVIIHTGGSTEAFCPKFADIVVDIVETGATLAANGLVEVHQFGVSSMVLIARKNDADPRVNIIGDALKRCL